MIAVQWAYKSSLISNSCFHKYGRNLISSRSPIGYWASLIKLDLYDSLILLVDSNDGGRMGIKFRLGEGMVVEALAPKLSRELLLCVETYYCTPVCWKAGALEIMTFENFFNYKGFVIFSSEFRGI